MPHYDEDDLGWDSPERWEDYDEDEVGAERDDVTDEFDEWLDEEEDAA